MAQSLRAYAYLPFTSMGYVQQELTALRIFILVFTYANGTTSQMTSPVGHWLLKIDCE